MLRSMDISMTRPCWRRSSGTRAIPASIAAVGEPGGSFLPPTWTSPASGHDLAAADLEGDVGEHALAGEPPYRQGGAADVRGLLGVELAEVPADHAAYEIVLGESLQRLAGDPAAVPQGGDPLAEPEDLLQAVRDEQHRRALLAQRPYDAEEPGDLGTGQGGGGLVHDQNAGVEGEGLGDLDDLLVGDGQAAAWLVGVEVDAEAGDQAGGGSVHGPVVDPAEAAAGLAAHEDVLGDGQVREERRLLVDHRDAGVPRVGGTVEDHGLAVDHHPAAVRAVHPREHFDQGRFPGAVLPCECVCLAGEELQGHALQSPYGTEGLGRVLQCEHRPSRRLRLVHMSLA
jgi:hypothetical protein